MALMVPSGSLVSALERASVVVVVEVSGSVEVVAVEEVTSEVETPPFIEVVVLGRLELDNEVELRLWLVGGPSLLAVDTTVVLVPLLGPQLTSTLHPPATSAPMKASATASAFHLPSLLPLITVAPLPCTNAREGTPLES